MAGAKGGVLEADVMRFGGLSSACFVSGIELLIGGDGEGELGPSVLEGVRFAWGVRAVLVGPS